MINDRIQESKRTGLHILLPMMIAMTALMIWAFQAQPVSAASNFIIEDYDIGMQVNEDDTYLITETLDVHFTASSHGIYRVIPYRITLDRDGQKDTFFAKVTDFIMLSGQPFEEDSTNSQWNMKIGDPGRYADEDTTYKYSYIFDMKGDHLKDADEVYYNLVGTSWEAQSIDHVSFRITFPKPIDMNNVGMKTGYQIDVPFETKGDTVIYGETTEDVLGGLTVRAVLPDNYFTKQAGTVKMPFYIVIGLLIVMALGGIAAWRRYGVDPSIVETEEFYPPENMGPAEVGYLNSEELSGEQVTSMLLALADKGYLKINDREVLVGSKKKKTKHQYELEMLREYDGTVLGEAEFMEGLFKGGTRPVVKMSQLKNSFYKTINNIKSEITDYYDDKLYDDKASDYAMLLKAAGGAGMIALVIISKIVTGSHFFNSEDGLIWSLAMVVLPIVLPLLGFGGIAKWVIMPRKSFFKYVIGFIGWAILILLGLGIAILFDIVMGPQIILFMIGMGMVFVVIIISDLCERKTDFYAETLGKIRGYKRFLEVAEKDRMEMLAEQDPDYYYKNLAYAFALGVTEVYAENFAALASQPPSWYDNRSGYSGSTFNTIVMMDSMNNMMTSLGSAMTSSPSGSGGGGGGGSFSGGGGAGGGGGGSW